MDGTEYTKLQNQTWPNVGLSLWLPSYLIVIFTHLKLCLTDAIHNFKWVKLI